LRKIAVIGGDGVGPEVVGSAVRALEATEAEIQMIPAEMGLDCHRRNGSYLPNDTLDILEEADACLFGAITSSHDPEYRSPLLHVRRHFELYVNMRPLRRIAPDLGLVNLDLVIFRENSEGMYTGEEMLDGGSVVLARRVSVPACRRLVRFAREWAEKEGRRRITCIHKANVIRKSDGLFRQVFFEEMASSTLEAKEMLVDTCAANMISNPGSLDCIATLNLYGDILSDEGAALVGGMGLAPSANIGEGMALFEPVHGSAPDMAGKGTANPVAAMLSAAMMLRHLGMQWRAELLEKGVSSAVTEGRRTMDIGGDLRTEDFTDEVVRRIESLILKTR